MEITFDWSATNPEEVLKHIYATNYPWVQQYVQLNSGNAADAEDIFQESVTAAWLNLREGRFSGNVQQFNAYLRQICKYKWLNHLKSGNHIKMSYRDDLSGMEPADTVVPLPAEQPDEGRLLLQCFGKLGKKCREVLGLFYYHRKSLAQIASISNNTEESMKTIKYRCMQKLRKLYLEQNNLNG